MKQHFFSFALPILSALFLAACSGGGNNEGTKTVDGGSVSQPVFKGELSLIAGSIGGVGDIDGKGTQARFTNPNYVAQDKAGNLYISDQYNYTIRKVAPDGTVTTLAGKPGVAGSADGRGQDARFKTLLDLAIGPDGNVYVIDWGNGAGQASIRQITPDGTVTTLAGNPQRAIANEPKLQDGTGPDAAFGIVRGIAVDANGDIYVSDFSEGQAVLRKITPAGAVTTMFKLPAGGTSLATDSKGNLFVASASAEILKISASGTITPFGVPFGGYQAFEIKGLAVDSQDNVYALDSGSAGDRIVRLDAASGASQLVIQSAAPQGDFSVPENSINGASDIVVDKSGNVLVVNAVRNIVQRIDTAGGVSTFAGMESQTGKTDGNGANARFQVAGWGISADANGNLLLTDQGRLRKISPAGDVTTIAGNGLGSGAVDGSRLQAAFNYPTGVALDRAGNAYVTDGSFTAGPRYFSSNSSIRKLSPNGEVTTVAGAATLGYADGVGTQARFNDPSAIVADAAGNFYIADTFNCVIRKMTPDAQVSTFAGTGCSGTPHSSRDGVAAEALFGYVKGLAIDASGNLYVSDFGTEGAKIRKITGDGRVNTLAGGAYGNADGKGSEARFSRFGSGNIAVDIAGNVYVADTANHSIRKVAQDGVVTTLIGGSVGIRLGSAPSLYQPVALTFVRPNELVITSLYCVLKLTFQ